MILKPLPVNLPDVVSALDDEDEIAQTRAYFDVETGEMEYLPFELDDESLFVDVLTAPHRWLRVPRLPTAERRRVRLRFIDEMNDPQVRLQLADALKSPEDGFAGFARLLRRTPGLSSQWLHHRDTSFGSHARAWLAGLGIDPV